MCVVTMCSLFRFLFFFFNDTATTEIYTLSLHDALPILALGLLDVVDPAGVVTHGVGAQPEDFGVAPVELRLEASHVTELGGAHRREVLGVREQDRPLVAEPLVKMNRALGRFAGEVGRFV